MHVFDEVFLEQLAEWSGNRLREDNVDLSECQSPNNISSERIIRIPESSTHDQRD